LTAPITPVPKPAVPNRAPTLIQPQSNLDSPCSTSPSAQPSSPTSGAAVKVLAVAGDLGRACPNQAPRTKNQERLSHSPNTKHSCPNPPTLYHATCILSYQRTSPPRGRGALTNPKLKFIHSKFQVPPVSAPMLPAHPPKINPNHRPIPLRLRTKNSFLKPSPSPRLGSSSI
jgi:hypothetical protein